MATSKKPVSRAVVGSTKKSKSLKKLSMQTMLFALVGVLAFSVIAGLGWQKWQVHQFKAKAASLPCLNVAVFQGNSTGGASGVCIRACKTYINAYGGVWKATWYINRGRNYALSPSLSDTWTNGARSYYTYYSGWWANSYQQFDSTQLVNANASTGISLFKGYSDPHGQLGVTFMSNQSYANPSGGVYGPNNLSNC